MNCYPVSPIEKIKYYSRIPLLLGFSLAIPLISAIALPIFAIIAIVNKIRYLRAYKATLTKGKRQPYGRVLGQDYTRWDGLQKPNTNQVEKNIYIHGRPYLPSKALIQTTAFTTYEDKKWLDKEYDRLRIAEFQNRTWIMINISIRNLIPIYGLHLSQKFKIKEKERLNAKQWDCFEAVNYHKNLMPDTIIKTKNLKKILEEINLADERLLERINRILT